METVIIAENDVQKPEEKYWAECDEMWRNKSLLDAYKNIETLVYRYRQGINILDQTQDSETVHYGVSAQDLEASPALSSAVKEDEQSGMKMVDARELSASNTAALGEVARKLEELENRIKMLEDNQ